MIKPFEIMTVQALWNDSYISKKMLQYHINGSNDIASRKTETINKTIDFIEKLLNRKKSFICDYGCGPGLYTDILQKRGHHVIGIDFSHNSIEYARSNNSHVNYLESNYIDLKLNTKFDLISLIYCDFSVLSPLQSSTLLSNIHNHLKPGGIFFFDVHNLNFYNSSDTYVVSDQLQNDFYMKGSYKVDEQLHKYKKEKIILKHIKVDGEKSIEFYNWFKCYSKEEITQLLNEHGFTVKSIFDNTYGGTNKNSDSMCIVAIKRAQ